MIRRLFNRNIIHKQNVFSSFISSLKSVLFQHLIDNFCLQSYLRKSINSEGKNKMYGKISFVIALWILKRVEYGTLWEVWAFVIFVIKTILKTSFILIWNVNRFYYLYVKRSVFKLVELFSVETSKELNNLWR